MYKTRLQELCRKNCWELPVYTSGKSGPCHNPRFTATVTVKGQVFGTPEEFRSVKGAQNTAARIAFEHFNVAAAKGSAPPAVNSQTPALLAGATPPPEMLLSLSPLAEIPLSPNPTSVPNPSPRFLQKKTDAKTKPANGEVLQGKCADTKAPIVSMIAIDKGYEGFLQKKTDAKTKPANGEVLQGKCADTKAPIVSMIAIDKGYEGFLQKKTDAKTKPANGEVLQGKCADTKAPIVSMIAIDKGYEAGLSMYKYQLQQYAQKEDLGFPVYTTEAQVPPHDRRFKSKVWVDGKQYGTPEFLPTLKEAEQAAAKVACQALSVGQYSSGLSMYKNQLKQYALKEDLGFPVYTNEAQGPPHDRRFKSKVWVDGKQYETAEFLPTLKEAEQAAAKVACQALSVGQIQVDGVLYKNLLQEFAQKKGLSLPSYEKVSSGMSHSPTFVSVVAIGTDTFRGAEAKNKKQAEMNAAKVAYFDLTKEHVLNAERAKATPGNMNVVHPPFEQIPKDQPFLKWKTVVFPRKLNWPIPECHRAANF